MPPVKMSRGALKYIKKFTENILDEERLKHVTCPIGYDLFIDPVFCCGDGITYEREHIERWFETHDTSPLTGAKLASLDLAPNFAMRAQADAMRKRSDDQPGERSNEVMKGSTDPVIKRLQEKIKELEEELEDERDRDWGEGDMANQFEEGLHHGANEAFDKVSYFANHFWSIFKREFKDQLKPPLLQPHLDMSPMTKKLISLKEEATDFADELDLEGRQEDCVAVFFRGFINERGCHECCNRFIDLDHSEEYANMYDMGQSVTEYINPNWRRRWGDDHEAYFLCYTCADAYIQRLTRFLDVSREALPTLQGDDEYGTPEATRLLRLKVDRAQQFLDQVKRQVRERSAST